MNIIETFKTSVHSLNSNKVRSALTMLGVIIGVFAVIVLISIGRGFQNYISDQFSALGSNLLFVAPGRVNIGGGDPSRNFSRNKMEVKHVELIRKNASDYIDLVTAYTEVGDSVKYKNKSYYSTVTGMDYFGNEMMNYTVEDGSFFTKSDVAAKTRVAVIGFSVAKELFPNRSPIGSTIKIGDDSYKVIGTLAEKGRTFDDQVLIPYTTAMHTFDLKTYSSIVLKVKDAEKIDEASKQVKRALMRDLHEDDFTVMSQSEILSSIQSILRILTIGLGAIAGISLLVGGIGIMNIMLVSVTERTREIGLRKAVGATPVKIATQFLIESILLSFGGGFIGLVLGWLGSLVGRAFMRTEVPWWAVVLAFGFAVFVGIVFGTYPAIQAAKKDPIEALRYE